MIQIDRKLILASGSPRRKELLKNLGIPFAVVVSGCDESSACKEPAELVKELSGKKCRATAEIMKGQTLVIGADTIVSLEGEIFGKPADKQGAYDMLQRLQGKSHEVFTGVTLILAEDGKILKRSSFTERTIVHVAAMNEEEIWDYIDSGEPMDKAGAYGIQGIFSKFISGIEGDYFNVVGLPVAELYRQMKNFISEGDSKRAE